MDPETTDSLYESFAAAYVRARLPRARALDGPARDDRAVVALGRAEGIRLHRFKRSAVLPRVRRVLGALRSFAPASLLDVGSGRGAFLWPLLDAMPSVSALSVERDARRAEQLGAVASGGLDRLSVIHGDVTRLPLAASAVDAVTLLEVLEHLEHPERAAREALRVARTVVIASVPSQPDDNPEHLRLYDRSSLERLFLEAGARRVQIEYVPGHAIAVVLR